MTFTLRCHECDAILTEDAEFEPAVPPKPCMDPDHPAYSDPGSIGYAEGYPEQCPQCGEPVDPDWAYGKLQEQWQDQIEAAMEAAAEAKYDDWKERDR